MGKVNLRDPRQPFNEVPILVFSGERGHIADLKQALCFALSRYCSVRVAVGMVSVMTYQYHFSKDRSKREILMIATDCKEAAILYEIYGRISQQSSVLRSRLATYAMSMDGHWDPNIAHALFQHHYHMDILFKESTGLQVERFQLN